MKLEKEKVEAMMYSVGCFVCFVFSAHAMLLPCDTKGRCCD